MLTSRLQAVNDITKSYLPVSAHVDPRADTLVYTVNATKPFMGVWITLKPV